MFEIPASKVTLVHAAGDEWTVFPGTLKLERGFDVTYCVVFKTLVDDNKPRLGTRNVVLYLDQVVGFEWPE
jgi:hypothetical protein